MLLSPTERIYLSKINMLHLGEPEFATIQNTPAVDAFHLTPSWSERPADDGATPTALVPALTGLSDGYVPSKE
jgi:hypothetical protein